MSGSHASSTDAQKEFTSVNVDAVSNQDQFSARVPPSQPLQTSGHKPGVQVSDSDRAPEFHAETLPPGSAPQSRTYEPQNTEARARGAGEEILPTGTEGMPGATSADVHAGLGKPMQGQTSVEERHDGMHGGKKAGSGLAGHAAAGELKGADPRVDEGQRALGKDVSTGRGEKGSVKDVPSATA